MPARSSGPFLYDSKYLTVFPVASAYAISDRVLDPIYPPTLITNISSAISIFRLCISSSISLVLVSVSSDIPSQTSLSPEWPKSPTLITIFPSSVSRFCSAKKASLNRVLPHSVMTLYSIPSNSHTHAGNALPGTQLRQPQAAHSASKAQSPHSTAAASAL